MKIYINPARYQQLMNFIDGTFPAAEQNSTLRQRLQDLGLRQKVFISPNVHMLTDRQVDVLQRILSSDNFTTSKIELYFRIYNFYNADARTIQINQEYEDDLAKLESLHLTVTQGESITLATPAPQVQHTAAIEIDAEEKAAPTSHIARSSYNLRTKRKNEAPSSSQSADQKKSRTDDQAAAANQTRLDAVEQHQKNEEDQATANYQTLLGAVKQLQENEMVLKSNQDFLQSNIQALTAENTKLATRYTTLESSYNDLQSRLGALEAKQQQDQTIAPAVAPDAFYSSSPIPLFFHSPLKTPSPIFAPVSPDPFSLADDNQPLLPNSPGGFTI